MEYLVLFVAGVMLGIPVGYGFRGRESKALVKAKLETLDAGADVKGFLESILHKL
jgi:hypothetical protein